MESNTPQHPTETPKDRLPLGRAAFLGTIAVGAIGVAAISKMGGMGVGNMVADVGSVVPGGQLRHRECGEDGGGGH